jgi:hypothetical protein
MVHTSPPTGTVAFLFTDIEGSTLDNRLANVHGLLGLAQVASVEGDHEHAARLFAVAGTLRERMGAVLDDIDRERYDLYLAATKSALGEEGFAAAWAEGRAMDLETACQLALSDPRSVS